LCAAARRPRRERPADALTRSRSAPRGYADVIFLALARHGLFRRLDAEKLRFFLGLTPSPLHLSRRYPLYRRLGLARMLVSRRYAEGVAAWLAYRADLYDGRQG